MNFNVNEVFIKTVFKELNKFSSIIINQAFFVHSKVIKFLQTLFLNNKSTFGSNTLKLNLESLQLFGSISFYFDPND